MEEIPDSGGREGEEELAEPTRLFVFDAFDPLEGKPPESVGGKFEGIARRARKILANRSREEIIIAADIISWLSECDLIRDRSLRELQRMAEGLESDRAHGDAEGENIADYGHEFGSLIYVMERMSLEGISDEVSNLTWPDLFAVLALGLIDDAAEWERSQRRPVEAEDTFYHMWHGPHAVEAMEALCMAEGLVRQANLQREKEKAVSSARQQAANKRHHKTNAIKREFIKFYHAATFRSRAEAAHLYYEGLDDDEKRLLAPTNAENTLLKALRAHLKGN